LGILPFYFYEVINVKDVGYCCEICEKEVKSTKVGRIYVCNKCLKKGGVL